MTPAADPEIRTAVPEDAASLSELSFRVWGSRVPHEFWRWRYFENPFGTSEMGVTVDEGRIVGRAGGHCLPMHTKVGDRIALHVSDNEIEEAYRSGATLLRMNGAVRAKHGGMPDYVAFQFAVAVDEARDYSIVVLGFEPVFPIVKFVKIVDPGPYLARKLPIPNVDLLWDPYRAMQRWRAGRRAPAGSERPDPGSVAFFDRLWERCEKRDVMVRKDGEYIRWRYLECPGMDYAVHVIRDGPAEGFVISHVVEKDGVRYGILDDLLCVSDSREAMEALCSVAVRDLIGRRVDAVLTWTRDGGTLSAALRELRFIPRPTPLTWIVGPGNDSCADEMLQDPASWSYRLGDVGTWMHSSPDL